MGVDFYPCDKCGETFPDCGDYASCEDCGQMLCANCMNRCGVGHNMRSEVDGDDDDSPCPFCNMQEVSDTQLLNILIDATGKTKDELIAEIKAKQ